MREISASIFPLQAANGRVAWSHARVCSLLLGIVMFCEALAWAQASPPAAVAVKNPNDAIPIAPSQQAKLRALISDGKVSLNCAALLGQTQTEAKSLCVSGQPVSLATKRAVRELASQQDDLPANEPKQWLTSPSDGPDDQSLSSRDLKYYGGRTPLIGKAIVRIAEQADSHPKITRVLLMIDPQF